MKKVYDIKGLSRFFKRKREEESKLNHEKHKDPADDDDNDDNRKCPPEEEIPISESDLQVYRIWTGNVRIKVLQHFLVAACCEITGWLRGFSH